jgi:hypothetical protein
MLLLVAACRDRAAEDAAAADSALARDLTLATTVASATPELRDTPDSARPPIEEPPPAPPVKPPTPRRVPPREQPRPVTRTPEPTLPPVVEAPVPVAATIPEPAPARRVGVIASGTSVGLSLDSRVCSNANRPGDKMIAHTTQAITGTNGVVIPAGSPVVIEVATVVQGRSADSSTITFRVKSIGAEGGGTHAATGDVLATGTLEKTRVATQSSDKGKVLGGAILGAVIGRVAGGGSAKGTIIGAAAGTAAGAAAAAASARYETCVPAGAPLRMTIDAPVEVELSPS